MSALEKSYEAGERVMNPQVVPTRTDVPCDADKQATTGEGGLCPYAREIGSAYESFEPGPAVPPIDQERAAWSTPAECS